MIYKSRREYDQAIKNLNEALYEGAHRAKQEVEPRNAEQPVSRNEKPVPHTKSG